MNSNDFVCFDKTAEFAGELWRKMGLVLCWASECYYAGISLMHLTWLRSRIFKDSSSKYALFWLVLEQYDNTLHPHGNKNWELELLESAAFLSIFVYTCSSHLIVD